MIAMTNTKGLTYAAIMLKVKDLQELITTYNAIMAGQLNIDEDLIANKILKMADELGIDHDELADLSTANFGVK
jgi:2-hydroxychromene-2-carboxylate isomerase